MIRALARMLDPVPAEVDAEPSLGRPVSQACTQAQMEDPLYAHWCAQIGEVPRLHRKQWEFCYILQALDTCDMLRPGRRALGFGVGMEPLPAVFARRGVSVLATDLEPQRAGAQGWIETDQHASSKAALNDRNLCEAGAFERLVDVRYMDMSAIDADLAGQFDFCWSACAFEHLGSIAKGLEFVERSIDCLRPGGIAVHTTELNCSSDRETLDHASTVLFRQQDFRALARRLKARGYRLVLNFNLGDQPLDKHIDLPPYKVDNHLKMQLEQWTTTSFGIMAVPITDRDAPEIAGEPSLARPVSQACTQAQCEEPAYARRCAQIGEPPRLHRKQWEYCYILQALDSAGMMRAGRSGLGFAVGGEPLAAAFAARGVSLLATDADPAARERLNDRRLCEPQDFARLVDFRAMSMADVDAGLADDLAGRFDFCWSSGAIDKLGSIEQGLAFVERALDCLRPGGIAVHTTEFNCATGPDTLDNATPVLFRQRDWRILARRLHARGYGLTFNFNLGGGPVDRQVDQPPYQADRHLKLRIGEWTATSFGIIAAPLGRRWRRP